MYNVAKSERVEETYPTGYRSNQGVPLLLTSTALWEADLINEGEGGRGPLLAGSERWKGRVDR